MAVLDGYHGAVGALDRRRRRHARRGWPATSLTVVFNDPLPCEDPARCWPSGSPSRCATACGSSPRAGPASASRSSRRPASPSATRRSAASAPTSLGVRPGRPRPTAGRAPVRSRRRRARSSSPSASTRPSSRSRSRSTAGDLRPARLHQPRVPRLVDLVGYLQKHSDGLDPSTLHRAARQRPARRRCARKGV